MSYARFGIENFDKIKKELEGEKKAAEKVMKRLTDDARKRVPGWVATEISKVYGVKRGEITGGQIGKMQVKGKDFRNLKFIYTGRLLTPTHFQLSPKAPAAGTYTLKATIIRGQRSTLGKVKKLTKKQRQNMTKNFTRSGTKTSDHSPIMLMRANGGHYLPFQRKSTNRRDIEVIKTISLPQMVSSERTRENIQKAINEGLEKRMAHHMKLLDK